MRGFCIVNFRFKNGIQVFYKYKSPFYKVTFSAIELFFESFLIYLKKQVLFHTKTCSVLIPLLFKKSDFS